MQHQSSRRQPLVPGRNPNANAGSAAAAKLRFNCKWVRDLPGANVKNGAVEMWAVKSTGERVRLRSTLISRLEEMRAANNIPTDQTDLDFLSQGMEKMLADLGFTSLEMAIAPMSPKKESKGGQSIDFPPDAMMGKKTTHGTINKPALSQPPSQPPSQ